MRNYGNAMFECRMYGRYSDYGPTISGINHEYDNHLELGHNWDTATDAIIMNANTIANNEWIGYARTETYNTHGGINCLVGDDKSDTIRWYLAT